MNRTIPLLFLVACATPVDQTTDVAEATTCSPHLDIYPVRGKHDQGYQNASTGDSTRWTCGDANSNSDFAAGDHLGNDIWAARGTPVVATSDGVLTETGWSDYSGNHVTIVDSCGWYYFMCHMDHLAPGIGNGAHVTAGQVVGYVGNTGTASNGVVHLHYSIYPDNNYDNGIDPWPYTHAVEHDTCSPVDDVLDGGARGGGAAVIDKYGTYHVFAVDDAGVLQHAFYDTTWHWQSLGGTVTGAPGVTYDPATHRFDVFAPGTNGQMYQQTYQAGWSGWHTIGGAGFYQGAAAVRDEGGTYHVFAIDGDGVLDQALYAGHGWTWQKIAGTVQGTPGVTYDPSSHRFDVFAPSPNGALYQDTYEGGKWQGFHRIGGANLAAGAGAVIDAAGIYHVFAIDAAGTLVQAIYNAGWTFQNLGGVVTGVPAVTYAAGNRFDVFAPSPNGRLYQKTYQSGWSAWHAIGGANL